MTQETRRDLRFPMFVCVVSILAVAATGVAWQQNRVVISPDLAAPLVTLLLAVLASEMFAVVVPDGPTVSLSYPLSVAAIVYFGPAYAAVFSAVSLLPSVLTGPRKKAILTLANLAQLVLCTVVAGLLFTILGGVPLGASVEHVQVPGAAALLPMAAAAVAGVLANALILGVGFSVLQDRPIVQVLAEMVGAWMLPSQAVLGLVGVAIAEVLAAVGWMGFALFVLPLLVARQTYQQSVKLREAYADTIKSLVAALEAKDVYTKGHSLRVADYAVRIARAMEFSSERVRRLETAALLHDMGKVGVSRRVLAKDTRLTDDEFAEIKRHPDIGAHIVADVPYLADLVPAIQHHHKRFDGGGYGGEARGTDVPLEARVLAVADSYDAMTSARPYRGAMSHEEATRELMQNSGSQFDPTVVEAFLSAFGLAASTRGSAPEGDGNE